MGDMIKNIIKNFDLKSGEYPEYYSVQFSIALDKRVLFLNPYGKCDFK
ncbi:MAG: hypothetical protein IKV87_02800 [Methanobrevibacter sp.]|nr:hypothetical protein [Methanobrevibacter sp.]